MNYLPALCIAALTLTTACAGPANQGVGFTGIGNEPSATRNQAFAQRTDPSQKSNTSARQTTGSEEYPVGWTVETLPDGRMKKTYRFDTSPVSHASTLRYAPRYRGQVPQVATTTRRRKQFGLTDIAKAKADPSAPAVSVSMGKVRGNLMHVTANGKHYGVLHNARFGMTISWQDLLNADAAFVRMASDEIGCAPIPGQEPARIGKMMSVSVVVPLDCRTSAYR